MFKYLFVFSALLLGSIKLEAQKVDTLVKTNGLHEFLVLRTYSDARGYETYSFPLIVVRDLETKNQIQTIFPPNSHTHTTLTHTLLHAFL